MRSLFGTILLAVLTAAPLAAQAEQGQFEVSTLLGWQRFDEAAALENGPAAGLEVQYFLRPNIAVGGYLSVGRPTTRGEYFPLVGLEFEDSTFFYLPDQTVTQIGFGLAGLPECREPSTASEGSPARADPGPGSPTPKTRRPSLRVASGARTQGFRVAASCPTA